MFFDDAMQTLTAGTYDEALERFHHTGPEFEGWLSNHGPMAVEALARRGSSGTVHQWTDDYVIQLETAPRAVNPFEGDEATELLGDPSRLGDWLDFFERQLQERSWLDVLVSWWPVLLPGIAAGATHGVIRTGHVVQQLRDEVTEPRVQELAQALGYWAARWQRVPVPIPQGDRAADALVTGVPRVDHQVGGIRQRLAQLTNNTTWETYAASLAGPDGVSEVPAALAAVVDAVVLAYPRISVGEPTMLVHAATAPHAVSRVLPSLPTTMWQTSFEAAWAATTAVLAAYLPKDLAPEEDRSSTALDPGDAWEVAVRNGGAHVVKLADTALDVHARTHDPRALAAITTAIRLEA